MYIVNAFFWAFRLLPLDGRCIRGAMSRLYFDYNATTPMVPTVRVLMTELMGQDEGNPSSVHQDGRRARRLSEEARRKIADSLDCEPTEVVFTSGATESNNTVFNSLWESRPARRNKIITTSVEHDSVFRPAKKLEESGAEIVFIPVERSGEIDWDFLSRHLDDRTLLVSAMLANNETGMIFPVTKIVDTAHKVGALVHCDAACAVGKIPISFKELGVDFLSLSAHKFYGPKGIGALLVRKGVHLEPLLLGGAQEGNRRSGTENLSGIVGMAYAIPYALGKLEGENRRLWCLRQLLSGEIRRIEPRAVFHEHATSQLPGTVNVAFPGLSGQTLMARLDLEGVSVSYGSACSSGTLEVSRPLLGMGIPEEEARSSIRISFGRMTTEEEMRELVVVMGVVIPDMKSDRIPGSVKGKGVGAGFTPPAGAASRAPT